MPEIRIWNKKTRNKESGTKYLEPAGETQSTDLQVTYVEDIEAYW